jgi:hypothetical protein
MRLGKLIDELALTALMVACSSLMYAQDAWNFPDLSGAQVFTSGGSEKSIKVYRSGSSVRVEPSPTLATLYVTSKSKVYNLYAFPGDSRHQCVVMRPEQATMLPSPLELLNGTRVKRTPAGTDVVEGHTCKVENVVVTRADGKTVESKVWEADDLRGVPVKIESQTAHGKLTAVYRDIVLGTPDAALFAIPDKCTSIEKMGQVAEHKIIK